MIPKFLSEIRVTIAPAIGNYIRRAALFAIVATPLLLGFGIAAPIRAQSTPTTGAPLPSFEVASS